jgi:hypothetical protein
MPKLTIPQILAWADAHHRRKGRWPTKISGPVLEAPAENWVTINDALRDGHRGLPGGLSLPKLLAEYRSRRPWGKKRLTIKQILAWADAHYQRTGDWPTGDSGPVCGVPGENWSAIDTAKCRGLRDLRSRQSLAQVLAEKHRGKRHRTQPPRLTIEQILAWADAHRRRTGGFANLGSGEVYGVEGENWPAINTALKKGSRGLRGGWSLHRLLVKYRGKSM